jgi:hypothetical protein
VFDAATSFRRGGVEVLTALQEVASTMRSIVRTPMEKGRVSRQLSDDLGDPYVRACRACQAVHSYEQPFRLAALQAGLVLQPGTSPPVLERVEGLRAPGYRRLAGDADPAFDVVRNHLRFFGPTTVADVAGYVDSPKREVQRHWPEDVEVVTVEGRERFVLAADVAALADPPSGDGTARLLGPFDPYLQLRDRDLLAPDAARRKDLWRTLGRPGAVVVDGEVLATWRPSTARDRLTVTLQPWRRFRTGERRAVEEQAERLAAFRGVVLADVAVA